MKLGALVDLIKQLGLMRGWLLPAVMEPPPLSSIQLLKGSNQYTFGMFFFL